MITNAAMLPTKCTRRSFNAYGGWRSLSSTKLRAFCRRICGRSIGSVELAFCFFWSCISIQLMTRSMCITKKPTELIWPWQLARFLMPFILYSLVKEFWAN
ncbi:hypothetical protein EMCG_06916 [[Emmonsia] crescens]|uniref:Uncharacterized protein n=1 Tax=[Emmonsia] crescens TaxID=73230 RepID=A0A0G2JBG0_9EURO|nr:hypothetical protein EMCG_06916 [Emmonsia crescens UAMH 3008]